MFWNLPGKLENLKKFRELSAFVFIYNKMLNLFVVLTRSTKVCSIWKLTWQVKKNQIGGSGEFSKLGVFLYNDKFTFQDQIIEFLTLID